MCSYYPFTYSQLIFLFPLMTFCTHRFLQIYKMSMHTVTMVVTMNKKLTQKLKFENFDIFDYKYTELWPRI